MVGRKPTPASMKRLEGNPGKRAIPPEPAFVVADALDPPPGLTEAEARHWRYYAPILARVRVLTEGDVSSLILACEAVAQIEDIKRLQAEPEYRRVVLSVTVDSLGNEKVRGETHPLDVQRRAWTQIARFCLAELGLSPASRSRVSVQPHETKASSPLATLQAQATKLRRVG